MRDTPKFAKNTWAWQRTCARVTAQSGSAYDDWSGKEFAAAQVIYRNTVRKYGLTGADDHPDKSFMEGIAGTMLDALASALWFESRDSIWAESGDGLARITFEREYAHEGFITGYGYTEEPVRTREGGDPKGKLVTLEPVGVARPTFHWAMNGEVISLDGLLAASRSFPDIAQAIANRLVATADELDEAASRLKVFDELPAGVDEPPEVDHNATAEAMKIEAAHLRQQASEAEVVALV